MINATKSQVPLSHDTNNGNIVILIYHNVMMEMCDNQKRLSIKLNMHTLIKDRLCNTIIVKNVI